MKKVRNEENNNYVLLLILYFILDITPNYCYDRYKYFKQTNITLLF